MVAPMQTAAPEATEETPALALSLPALVGNLAPAGLAVVLTAATVQVGMAQMNLAHDLVMMV